MKRQMMAVTMGVLCLGATLATATPASAGTNISWKKTTDTDAGGMASFTHNGDKITACDLESDGWAARVYLWGHDGTPYGNVQDGGFDNKCKGKALSTKVPEGALVRIEVCLIRKYSREYCRSSSHVRA